MNSQCGREWSRKFLTQSFPASFVSGPFKKHREDVIFDKERALLPATQPYAEARREAKTVSNELAQITKTMKELAERRATLQQLKYALESSRGIPADSARRQFIKPCPAEECRGFLSSQYKCGMCEIWCCPDCNVIIGVNRDAPHTCDPNDVESVKMMKTDTKPCPKCAVPIFKIDGCDQIWCTLCHVAFSFRTGAIEQKIHNPHYYEWLRKTEGEVPREPLDNVCGEGDLDQNLATRLMNLMNAGYGNLGANGRRVMTIIRNVQHIRLVMITAPVDIEQNNRELRVRYLNQEIDEARFKVLLQQTEKKDNKSREMQEIYQMVVTTVTDILRRFCRYLTENPVTASNMKIIDEIGPLKDYANDCLKDIYETYGGQQMRYYLTDTMGVERDLQHTHA